MILCLYMIHPGEGEGAGGGQCRALDPEQGTSILYAIQSLTILCSLDCCVE